MTKLALACSLLLLPSLAAQDEPKAAKDRFRIGAALASGTVEFDQGPSADDQTDAGLFRLQFEFIGAKDFGGGVRFESLVSDDDLFQNVSAATEERNADAFVHFSWRLGGDRFRMPLRVGILVSQLELEAESTNQESTFTSFGPYVELGPELVLVGTGRTQWSLYAETGIGWAATVIELDAFASQEFESSTVFFGAELGTRLRLGVVELGLAYVGRFQSMQRSDPEGGSSVASFDASFQGALLSFALCF